MGFDRNIVTEADVAQVFVAPLSQSLQSRSLGVTNVLAGPAVTAPTADDYMTKLVKYIPLEILGAYLFLSSLITQNVTGASDLAIWLAALLILSVAMACLYDYFVLHIQRRRQILMSGIGIAIYVFAAGGWFATTSWYHPWYGTALLPIYALAIQFLKLPPLPTEG